MPVNPADGPVMGALYGTDAMRAAMGEHAFLQRMLEVEAALARAQSRLGIVPAAAAEAITAVSRVLDIGWIPEALQRPARIICPRSTHCPRQEHCDGHRQSQAREITDVRQEIIRRVKPA